MTVKGKNGMTDKKDKGITALRSPKSVFKAFSSFFNSKFSILNSQFGFKGFTLIEMLVVIIIAGILAAIAIPSYMDMVKKHKLTQYGTEMEYLVKYAKIVAMERTRNVGVCVDSSTSLILYDIGTSRGAGICTGTSVKNMTVTSSDASGYNISVSGSGASFDPRGLAIWNGYVCVANNVRYVKVCISRTGVRTEEGNGGCSACSP